MAKSALRALPGPSKRRVRVAFAKDEAPIRDDRVINRMRLALDVGGDERLLDIKIVIRQYDSVARAFIFEGEAQVMPVRSVQM
jgi:hypothetical protein